MNARHGNKSIMLTSLRLDRSMFKHQNTFTRFHNNMRTGQSQLTLTVIGGIVGIVGITQNEKSLDKFFIIAQSCPNYCMTLLQNTYGSDNNDTTTQHHEVDNSLILRNALVFLDQLWLAITMK